MGNGLSAWLRRIVCGCGLALGALTGATASEAEDASGRLARLQGWLSGTRDLQGRFEQSLVSGAFGAGTLERGRLWIERPGRMRWDYSEPERKVALVDGDRTKLYLESERQLYLGTLDSGDLLSALLTGRRPLDELFVASVPEDPVGAGYGLRLEPRDRSSEVEHVLLELDPENGAIRRAEVTDAAGNRMLYRFAKLQRNRGIPEERFRFEAPPGTIVSAAP